MNKIINVAVIGCSGMAEKHMDGVVACKNSNLYALCDIHQEILDKKAEKYSPEVAVTDYKELVNDKIVNL